MNRSGIHDIPHQAGPKGSIQYCEAIPAMNKTEKNIINGANEPLRYPGANRSEIINAKIIAAKIDMIFVFQTSELIFFYTRKINFQKATVLKLPFGNCHICLSSLMTSFCTFAANFYTFLTKRIVVMCTFICTCVANIRTLLICIGRTI